MNPGIRRPSSVTGVTQRTMLGLGWALLIIGVVVAIISLATTGHPASGPSSSPSTSSSITYGVSVAIGWVITAVGGVILLISQLRRSERPGRGDVGTARRHRT
jgi:hypothetical protein